MIRIEEKTFSGKKVFIYDPDVCKIFYDYDKNEVVVSKNGIELDRFGSDAYFVEQINTKIIVGEFNEKFDLNPRLSVNYYSSDNYKKICVNKHEIESCVIDNIRLDNGVYILQDEGKYVFYNPKYELFSSGFDCYRLDKDNKLNMNNMILVDEVISVTSVDEKYPIVSDKIRYGIDMDNFKSKTKIYSFNQDAFIDIYTDCEILSKGVPVHVPGVLSMDDRHYGSLSYDYELDQTILDKVIYPLKLKASEMLNGKKRETINCDFIKKLGGN